MSASLTITLTDQALRAGDTSVVTFRFAEEPAAFTAGHIAVEGGTLWNFAPTIDPLVYEAAFTPAAGLTDNSNVISVDMTQLDFGGTPGTGIATSDNYTIDTESPTATISLVRTALKAGETTEVTFTFSEAVTGFTTADVTAPNGALTGLSSSDGGVTWTATFTPNENVNDVANLLVLHNTGLTDLAGNPGVGSTESVNFTIETVRPTAVITMNNTALKVGDTAQVTITFSEAVSGFDNTDLTIEGGALSPVSSQDGGVTWTATFTPTTNFQNASNVISLNMTGVRNASSNAGLASVESDPYGVDTARPTATIVVADNQLEAHETTTVTITFSEVVSGLNLSDLSVANGNLTHLSSSDGGKTWTATLTPTAQVTDATNLIILDTSLVTDGAGNSGAGIAISNNYAVGYVPPAPQPPTDPMASDNVITLADTGGRVEAGAGDDVVTGGAGADFIHGNTGDDRLSAGEGSDTVCGGQGQDFVQGGKGADLLFGDLGDDTVHGGQGDDLIQGGAGADYVSGDLGNDTVRGGKGDDVVHGGAGDDFLSGDLGDDVLTGGAGRDIFNFVGGAGRDVVTDFSKAEGDVIWLSSTDAADFAALSAKFSMAGADTVITLGAQVVVLVGVASSSLTASDFMFG